MKNNILKPTLIILATGCSLYLLAIIALMINAQSPTALKADYAIVYGNKVNADGTPSKRLQARLDAAYDLYTKKVVSKIYVSGAVGKEKHDESLIMKYYLLYKDVPDSVIIRDSEGATTYFTSTNAAQDLGKSSSVIAVTQKHHVPRTKMSLRHAGFTEVTGAYPRYWESRNIYSYVREVPAWLKYWAGEK